MTRRGPTLRDTVGSPVGSREILAVDYTPARKITYEVPGLHRHEHLVTLDSGVVIYHADHVASFAIPQWINPIGHYVYVAWGTVANEDMELEEDVLYVGVSSKILYRFAQHSLSSAWWGEAEHIDVYEYATRDAADEAERFLIASYGPLYNSHGKQSKSRPLAESLR